MTRHDELLPDGAAEGAHERLLAAWHWLCEQRTAAPDHADVWGVRWQVLSTGPDWLTRLTHRVLSGTYRLTPLQLHGKGQERKAVWGAQDALVLKWAALSLQHLLPLHPACEHVKGHGGGNQSVAALHGILTGNADLHTHQAGVHSRPYTRVCRTDIRGYYRHINKQTLMAQINQHVTSPVLRDLVHQYVHYTVEDGGTFHTPNKGISRGCPLSPLMGALHLYDMDEHFSQQPDIYYARYMDDVIILAKSRWSLRKHTKRLMQWFGEYGFEAHPDKTFIGSTAKGFDWMGAWLTHEGVTDIAPRAKANHREKVRRLYEQLARLPLWKRKSAAPQVHARVSTYRKRWNIWARNCFAAAPAVAVLLSASTCCHATTQLVVSLRSGISGGGRALGTATAQPVKLSWESGHVAYDFYLYTVMAADGPALVPHTYNADNGSLPTASQYYDTDAARKCGLTIGPSIQAGSPKYFPPGYWGTYDFTVNGVGTATLTPQFTVFIAETGTGPFVSTTCAQGTKLLSTCLRTYPWQPASTPKPDPGRNPSAPVSSCQSGEEQYDLILGAPYSPAIPPTCSITVGPSTTPYIGDIANPTGASPKGTILSVGDSITITNSCSTPAGGAPTMSQIQYSATGADFTNAGYDQNTNTYVGLIAIGTGGGAQPLRGDIITNSALWSASIKINSGQQQTTLAPVVLAGASVYHVGMGQVTATVTTVSP